MDLSGHSQINWFTADAEMFRSAKLEQRKKEEEEVWVQRGRWEVMKVVSDQSEVTYRQDGD